MTTIITIANQKGGVGKTTTAVSLAHGLALRGKEVLLIDLDPQGQCATALGLRPEPGTFYLLVSPQQVGTMVAKNATTLVAKNATTFETTRQWVRNTGRKNMWLIPGDTTTSAAQTVINAEGRSLSCVRNVLKPFIREGLNYILFDTAPSVGGIQERAVWAANLVIIPTATEFLASDGLSQMVQTLTILQKEKSWEGALLGVLPTFFDEQTRESRANIESLRETFGNRLLAPIHRATVLRECASEALTIFEKDQESRSAKEYANLVNVVLKF